MARATIAMMYDNQLGDMEHDIERGDLFGGGGEAPAHVAKDEAFAELHVEEFKRVGAGVEAGDCAFSKKGVHVSVLLLFSVESRGEGEGQEDAYRWRRVGRWLWGRSSCAPSWLGGPCACSGRIPFCGQFTSA